MGKQAEFFLDVGSPTTYLAWTQLPGICERHNAELILRPMLLGAVFKATGNASPISVPAKGQWMLTDLARFAERYRVPFRLNPHFPVDTLVLMRAAAAVQRDQPQALKTYLDAVFRAIWVDERDMGDNETVARVLGEADFEPETLLAQTREETIKERLKADTREAVERGVFGAPTVFVGDAMFFGQDRLDFVEEALCGE